jgi:aspartate carbamoyltransferase catalytic subunit
MCEILYDSKGDHMTHLLSVDQFDPKQLRDLFDLTHELKHGMRDVTLSHKQVCTLLFYEPSTRTSSSFASAMLRLGGSVIPIQDVSFSSVSKGETLEDTVRVMSGYSDVIVLRHPEQGAAVRAAKSSLVPIINGGDGVGEHPTQALLDLYTIHDKLGLNRKLRVALVGDLKHGRTVHSLCKLLRQHDVQIDLVYPEGLEMPPHLVHVSDRHHRDLWGCISDVDVIYMTRVQQERMSAQHKHLSHVYDVTLEQMQLAKPNMILMHPLPRRDELPTLLDADPRSVYFEQTVNGMWVRQAIFVSLFGRDPPCWNPVTLT